MFSEVINAFAKFLWIADNNDLKVTSDVESYPIRCFCLFVLLCFGFAFLLNEMRRKTSLWGWFLNSPLPKFSIIYFCVKWECSWSSVYMMIILSFACIWKNLSPFTAFFTPFLFWLPNDMKSFTAFSEPGWFSIRKSELFTLGHSKSSCLSRDPHNFLLMFLSFWQSRKSNYTNISWIPEWNLAGILFPHRYRTTFIGQYHIFITEALGIQIFICHLELGSLSFNSFHGVVTFLRLW